MINYTKFEHFFTKMSSLWDKSSLMGKKVEFLYYILHAYIPSSSFATHAYLHIYGFTQLDICDKLH